ncbi:hypothetical protein DY000_02008133 [Brassica cretica]|uniref:Retrotransposon gag domain-containing protein n=1 Tax=Brassica cretica TaxID=69181 RepID=A0ABQ7BX47_BRACR|nr:hypothetical protein DY000_02008133 [Brassica cretica]
MAVDEQDNPSESTPREAELPSSGSKVLRSLLSSNLKTLFSETRIKPSTRQATRSAASAHRSDPCRAWTHPTPQEVPLDSLQVKPRHQEKKAGNTRVHETISSDSEPDSEKETSEGAAALQSSLTTYLEQMFSKKLDAMQFMVEKLPGVAPPIRKCNLGSYADTPFTDSIALIVMPRKFSFPNIKMYNGTGDPDDHIAQYKQRMLAINLHIGSISSFATLSDGFVEQLASSRNLEKTSDHLNEILQHRVEPLRDYISLFNQEKVSIPECNVTTAISAFKRGLLPDGDLYKELTKYQCKNMEDVLSRAWAQVKWEEDVASRARTQQKKQPGKTEVIETRGPPRNPRKTKEVGTGAST